MAISEEVEQVEDDSVSPAIEQLIEQKVEKEVEQRVAEETSDFRSELEAERKRTRMLERALAERDRKTTTELAPISLVRYGFAMLARALAGADADYSADPKKQQDHFDHLGDTIQDLENTVARHDSIIEEQGTPSGNSKEKKWQDTIQAAENLKDKADHKIGDGWVKLFTDNIEQATGCSDRRAGQLIDEWSEEKRGTEKVPYKRFTTSRKTKSSSIQRKALKIDLDVWGNDE